MIQSKSKIIILVLILIIASFLRLYNLEKQGFLHYDSSIMSLRAHLLKSYLSSDLPEKKIQPLYVDTKPVWLFFIAVGQHFFNNLHYSASIVASLFGLLCIVMTFIFVRSFYKSESIALLSALFLSISSYHVFYSRIGLPETASIFFLLVVLYLYFIGMQKGHIYVIISGIICGLAFLANRYRILMFPVFILVFEIHMYFIKDFKLKEDKFRYFIFFFSALLTFFFYIFFIEYISIWGIKVAPYAKALQMSLKKHSFSFDIFSIFTYPYYIYKFEGFAILSLLVISFFFLRKKINPIFPLLIISIQVIASSIADEKCARSISIVLPFISIASAISFYNIVEMLEGVKYKNFYVLFIIILLVFTGMRKSLKVTGYKSDMENAVALIKEKYGNIWLISTNAADAYIYVPRETHVAAIDRKTNYEDLRKYKDLYGAIIIEPLKYIKSTASGNWNEKKLSNFIELVEANCKEIAVFDHYRKNNYLERFLLEHTKPNLRKTLNLIKSLDEDAGKMKIYDVQSCFNK